MNRPNIKVGDYVCPDGWGGWGEGLQEDDGFKDGSFPGCQFRLRLRCHPCYPLAVNIKITSRKANYRQGNYGWYRCKIEFVGDGEPSQFSGGWIFIPDYASRNFDMQVCDEEEQGILI